MRVIKNAREEALAKVEDELHNISEELPLSRELTPNETNASIERSVQNTRDLEAGLQAEEVHLRTSNNTQYAMDQGLMPFTYTDKDEEKVDADKLSVDAGVAMDVPSLWEKMERESPDLARTLAQASSTLMRRSHTSGGTFSVWGPCPLSSDKQCVSSPGHPGSYGNNQVCWIRASADFTLHVDTFDTETYWDWFYVDGTYYSGQSGPAGRSAKANGWMVWYSDYSATRPGWKICSSTSAATVPCLYGRHDVCGLQFRQVPVLASHNSGAFPTLYLECGRKKQECVDWATRARETCNEHVYECTNWASEVRQECSNWGTECTSWANRYCGWFGWLCGSFCTASRYVCTGFTYVTHAVCHGYGWVCKGFTYFVEYVGCNAYKWVCEAASDLGIVGCLWENQGHNIMGQLARGVRFLDFDTCLVNMKLFHCHGNTYEQRAIGTEVEPDIKRIHDWLDGNPGEVLAIGWSNVQDGLEGVDYPASEGVPAYHDRMRQEVIDKYFTMQTGTSCGKVCYATDDTMKLGDMISKNIRLVVGKKKGGLFQQDSYSDDSAKYSGDEVMAHMEKFCDGNAEGIDGKLTAGNSAGLAMFVSLQSTAAYRFDETGTYNLECPNHCTHPNGQAAACECKAGTGKVMTLTAPSAMVEGAGGMNESGESQIACNSWNAGTVNKKVPGRIQGIVDKCYARNSPVSVVMVDYVEKSNSDIQQAVQVAINTAVTKFR